MFLAEIVPQCGTFAFQFVMDYWEENTQEASGEWFMSTLYPFRPINSCLKRRVCFITCLNWLEEKGLFRICFIPRQFWAYPIEI